MTGVRPEFRLDPYAAVKRAVRASGPTSGEVRVLQVDPGLWARAMAEAEGDPTRIEVVSETEVVVRNRSRR